VGNGGAVTSLFGGNSTSMSGHASLRPMWKFDSWEILQSQVLGDT